jgi:hypothetical protein
MFGLLNPWTALALTFALIASHGFSYYKGYQSASDKAKVQLLKETQAKVEAMNAYELVSREYVKAFQTKQVETKIIYRTIKEQIKDETTGKLCLNDDAGRLWNNALEGVLPKTATGTVATPEPTYSDEAILTNAIENFEQYNDCRAQLNALIDWHEKH